MCLSTWDPARRGASGLVWSKLFVLGINQDERCCAERKSTMKNASRIIVEMGSCLLLPTAAMLVLLAGPANAADESVKEKAAQCTPCHGETGISQTENTPSLAGQPDLYLQRQLGFFRSGLPGKRDHSAAG